MGSGNIALDFARKWTEKQLQYEAAQLKKLEKFING